MRQQGENFTITGIIDIFIPFPSTSTTWALYNLGIHQDVQAKLREELLNVASDQPSMEEINALPYLDHFVHEV